MRRDNVLISAILFSIIWHLFWLSALTVVVSPKDSGPIKFSNVSFLGPILESNMLSVSVTAHEPSIAEKRYLSYVSSSSQSIKNGKAGLDLYARADIDAGGDYCSDETITSLAISAIAGEKLEP